MRTSYRGLLAVSLASASIALATPAFAQDEEAGASDTGSFTLSANAALTTDYRFRGVSLSGGDPAIQGGFDVAHDSGFYVGTWASSIDDGGTDVLGDMELDLYGGWSGDVAEGVNLNVGLLYYVYPTEDAGFNTDYFEPYAKIGFNLGPATATVGAAYAWDQSALGDNDNLYLSTDLGYGIAGTPLALSAHLGYTSGQLAPTLLAGNGDDTAFDWSVGASATVDKYKVSVSYVGVQGPSIDSFTNDAVVATLSASF